MPGNAFARRRGCHGSPRGSGSAWKTQSLSEGSIG
jgi:hypothetical protein